MVDFILGFHTGYVVSCNFRRRIVMDGRQVAMYYLTRGSCVVDFLSTVAWLTQVSLPKHDYDLFDSMNPSSTVRSLWLGHVKEIAIDLH